MNKTTKTTLMIITFIVIGFLVSIGMTARIKPLDLHKNKIEMQLAKYKQAQEICGKKNVMEITEYVNERTEETGEYTCESFSDAARTPEEKMAEEEEERLYQEWVNYRGTMSFSEWKDRK